MLRADELLTQLLLDDSTDPSASSALDGAARHSRGIVGRDRHPCAFRRWHNPELSAADL